MDPQLVQLITATLKIGAQPALRSLLGLEDEQTKLLRTIEHKIDAGLSGPYKAGCQHLNEAAQCEYDDERRRQHLMAAERELFKAVGIFEDVDPLRSAWAAIRLTAICNLIGDSGGAGRWAIRAYGLAVRGVQQQCEVVNGKIDARIGTSLRLTGRASSSAAGSGAISAAVTTAAVAAVGAGAGALFLPVGAVTFAGMKMYRSHRIRQGRETLTSLDDFASKLREAAILLTESPLQGYSLSFDDEAGYFSYTRPLILGGAPAGVIEE